MGLRWHFLTFGSLLIIHHLWFFMLESFRWDEFLETLQKTFLSGGITFILCITLQYVFFKKEKSR
jgi:RsiW-degrading membrane proteinase PrsW (M82 family)